MSKIYDQMVKDFLDFSKAANERSTVDLRDGLKPVHRRILYTLGEMKTGYLGSNKVVGEVMGSLHPHGDSSVYDAAIRLAQPFKTRYPLVEIDGNKGTIANPNGFAASRYTKMKLSPLGEVSLYNIKKDSVPMVDNYDGSTKEPEYLTGIAPITLMNGTLGIGVGMASSIPPHNLNEISKAIVHLISNPTASTKELMRFIKGPDFPTGGTITNPDDLLEAYETGSGSVRVVVDYEVKTIKGKTHIIIKEVPFLADPTKKIIEPIQQMYADGYEHIEDIEVQTGKNIPFQLDITLSKDAPVFKVIEKLLKETEIESHFGVNLTTFIGDNKFQRKGLKELLRSYIDQNLLMNNKVAEYDLNKAKDRLLIVLALIAAIAQIDEVVRIIKSAKDTSEARSKIISLLGIQEAGAKAILAMRLSQLTKLDATKLEEEKRSLEDKISEMENFLSSKDLQLELVKTNIEDIAKHFGDTRRTRIQASSEVGEVEDITVFLTKENEIYAQLTDKLAANRRNTKGKKGENIISVVQTKSNAIIWVSSDNGMAYPIEVASLNLSEDIVKNSVDNFGVFGNAVQVFEMRNKDSLVSITDAGTVKRSSLNDYNKQKAFRVAKIREGESLSQVLLLDDDESLVMILDNNKYVYFPVTEINSTSIGTIGTKLGSREVISVSAATDSVVFVDKEGNGKQVNVSDLKPSGRKTSGLACNDAIGVYSIDNNSNVYIFGDDGKYIRIPQTSISKVSNLSAKGVILYNGNIAKILTD